MLIPDEVQAKPTCQHFGAFLNDIEGQELWDQTYLVIINDFLIFYITKIFFL